jgi:hypothetical protein
MHSEGFAMFDTSMSGGVGRQCVGVSASSVSVSDESEEKLSALAISLRNAVVMSNSFAEGSLFRPM